MGLFDNYGSKNPLIFAAEKKKFLLLGINFTRPGTTRRRSIFFVRCDF